jgi:hypothetical protein
MITYCITCKNDTETSDTSHKTSRNNRTIMKGKCIACGRVKCQFVEAPPVRAVGPLVPKEGGDLVGIFNTITSKFKLSLQKFEGELHIPAMNFAEPGTNLEYRLNNMITHLKNGVSQLIELMKLLPS